MALVIPPVAPVPRRGLDERENDLRALHDRLDYLEALVARQLEEFNGQIDPENLRKSAFTAAAALAPETLKQFDFYIVNGGGVHPGSGANNTFQANHKFGRTFLYYNASMWTTIIGIHGIDVTAGKIGAENTLLQPRLDFNNTTEHHSLPGAFAEVPNIEGQKTLSVTRTVAGAGGVIDGNDFEVCVFIFLPAGTG